MTHALIWPPILLVFSNIVMTLAWYGHLKAPSWPLWVAVLVSWGIAFFDYCFAVPANRIGYGTYTGQQLKIMQEVITLGVFAVFSIYFLGEELRWNIFAAGACLVAAACFILIPGR